MTSDTLPFQRGPDIQDNGSGSAALLEIAEQIAKLKTVGSGGRSAPHYDEGS